MAMADELGDIDFLPWWLPAVLDQSKEESIFKRGRQNELGKTKTRFHHKQRQTTCHEAVFFSSRV
jgi:hypothetical protein